MSQKKNIDEFLDPEILNSLKTLGLVPPQTIMEFIELDEGLKRNPLKKPEKLKDSFAILNSIPQNKVFKPIPNFPKLYEQNLAQAAREGKSIPIHIRQKMKQDKQNSKKQDGK